MGMLIPVEMLRRAALERCGLTNVSNSAALRVQEAVSRCVPDTLSIRSIDDVSAALHEIVGRLAAEMLVLAVECEIRRGAD